MERLKQSHKEEFKKYCQKTYDDQKTQSKTITEEKAQKIRSILKGGQDVTSANMKHWVLKTKQFQIMDRPDLGLKDALCLPAKKKQVHEC